MDLLTQIQAKACSNHTDKNVQIGIGLGDNRETIEASVKNAHNNNFADVIVFETADEMLTALSQGRLNGAVRGTLPANDVVTGLKTVFKIDQLMRLACIKLPMADKYIFVAPVGIDEGLNIDQKLEFVKLGREFIKKLDVDPVIGILASGRPEDRERSPQIADALDNVDKLVDLAKANNIDVTNYGILIEEAVQEATFIIMPDGVTGNLIFRTLHFLGGAAAIGAPVLNLDKIFIDTSRSKKSYVESIAFASALVE
jgi:putative methanogen marker protein 4